MRICIHRGTREIGGTCVELESGQRILLDLGLPLNAKDLASTPLPTIAGLTEADPNLLAIILSHGHRDHWGLLPKARPDIPVVMGRDVERIMRAAADFVPDGFAPKASAYLENRKQLGCVLINLAQCPLRSENDRSTALPANDAKGRFCCESRR